MYSVEELEDMVLAMFWHIRFVRDRLPDQLIEDVNDVTGLPNSTKDLKPLWQAESGDTLALKYTPVPSDMAASMIRRTVSAADGGEDEYKDLNLIHKHQWTEEECDTHRELTYRIKVAAHKLAEKGWINLRPTDYDESPQALGEDGLTQRFQITPSGLSEAKRRVPGTKWESQDLRRGWARALPKSEWQQAPEWLKAQNRLG